MPDKSEPSTGAVTASQKPAPSKPGAANARIYVGPTDHKIGLPQFRNFRDGIPEALKAKLSPVQLGNFKTLEELKKHDFKNAKRPVRYVGKLVKKLAK